MPTYQYVCTECGGQVEALQKFTDDPLTEHEVCGGRLRKVFSPVGIVFKGSGFYRTDSRKGSSASTPASASSSATSSDSSGSSASGGEKGEKTEKTSSGGEKTKSAASSSGSSSSSSGEKVA